MNWKDKEIIKAVNDGIYLPGDVEYFITVYLGDYLTLEEVYGALITHEKS